MTSWWHVRTAPANQKNDDEGRHIDTHRDNASAQDPHGCIYGHAYVVSRLVFKQGIGLAAPADVLAMSAATEQSFTYKMLRPSSDHSAGAAC
jgi:hypothetical protein